MQTLRFACRQLLRNPGYSVVAIVTLLLGIGGTTAMFSVLNAVLFRTLPYPDSERLVRIYRTSAQSRSWPHSAANHLDLRAASKAFSHLAAFTWRSSSLAEPGQPAEMIEGIVATASLFDVLATRPLLGRGFTADEDQPGRDDVVVISHGFWVNRFAADPAVLGRTLRLDGAPVTVIGVMPEGFDHPLFWGRADLWRPLALTPGQVAARGSNWLAVLGRLAPGVTLAQAQAELDLVASRLVAEHPDENAGTGLRAVRMSEAGMDDTGRQISLMTLCLTAFVLLIACVNLANLQFAHTAARTRELAVRAALGAPRHRLLRQLLGESLLLAVIGGTLGLGLAVTLADLIGRRIWIYDRAGIDIPLDPQVLLFALASTVLSGLGFGLVPAWLASRTPLHAGLQAGGRGFSPDRTRHRLRQALIVSEVALALILLSGAGHFVRGLQQLLHRDPGWQVDGLLTARLALPPVKYATDSARRSFFQELEQRLAGLPGITHASLSWSLPLWSYSSSLGLAVEGRPDPRSGEAPLAFANAVTPGYFQTLGIPLLEGRTFTATDDAGAPLVAIVNREMAQRLWPGTSALGRRIGNPGPEGREWWTVVGVVGDVAFPANLAEPDTRLQMYRPLAQSPGSWASVALRGTVPPDNLVQAAREAVSGLDPDQPLAAPVTAREAIHRFTRNYSLTGGILAAFAGLGLVLAAVGIYGVMSHFVVERRQELGIRLALGARPGEVLTAVLGRGLRLAILGSVAGLAGAIALTRILARIAPSLGSTHPAALGGVLLLLAATATLACWLPARRAAGVDPMTALRTD